jgi:formamidopyrimidine-DNA glycosylase
MPELPELEVLREYLLSNLRGKRIERITFLKPYVLKNVFNDDLRGQQIRAVTRRGKYLIVHLDRFTVVLHLMLRGHMRITNRCRVKKSLTALIQFTDGSCLEIAETGHKKMMKIYVYPAGKPIPLVERLGCEPLAPGFDAPTLQSLLLKQPCQLLSFLRSQRSIAGIGSAYADEILWAARLSPFKRTTSIKEPDIEHLLHAIKGVLTNAIEQVRRSGTLEKRDFLNVHGKKGIPCPRCGETICSVSFSRSDVHYCPKCQTRGRKLKDRRMSKFFR